MQCVKKFSRIHKETFFQLQQRTRYIIPDFSVYYIDRVIDSMWKQIDLVVKQNGQKVKY